MKINKKAVLISASLILCLIVISSTASAATLKVGPKEKYKTIQKAVNAAHEGDTIIVSSGTYRENVNITKSSLTILGKGYPKVNGFYDYIDPYSGDFGQSDININGFSITKNGIDLSDRAVSGQIIRNNYFYSCDASISGDMASGNLIKNNDFTNGGIFLSESSVDIIGNKIKNADIGIELFEGAGSTTGALISKNKITGCNVGIKFHGFSSGDVYDNYFNNKKNIVFGSTSFGSVGSWNTTKTPDYNIVLGPYIGGNFWGSPNGKGFSQTASDKNYDGIADSSYAINSKNIDYLPLVAIKAPVASFKMSKSSGKAPLTVKFTDTSKGVNMTEKWNFGDGSTSTLKNPSHKYTKVGKFKVTLTETNKVGSSSKSQLVKVTK
ncbi:cell surface protein [Methanosarcina barkeri 3]|uniref:Cell surface protein n=1 Tax=Methanosarcina barkeri 3 TaxID=1434107 RepID=A0A0E3WUW5_METBA|nr:NosD domain-containing protein [Methanosarcina barkeri]AKB81135.1 cell surface protein [Methanosarcina barkeri 3]